MHKYVRKDMEGSRSFAPQMNTDTAKSGLEDYFPQKNVIFQGLCQCWGT
jgi:hypothetical protein